MSGQVEQVGWEVVKTNMKTLFTVAMSAICIRYIARQTLCAKINFCMASNNDFFVKFIKSFSNLILY